MRSVLEKLRADFPTGAPDATHVHWQCPVYVDDVPRAQRVLARHGIDIATTNLVYLPDLPAAAPFRKECPGARRIVENATYLPVHPRVTERDLQRCATALRELFPTTDRGRTGAPRS
jgi:dTDP-4-amino-4,6-dideoxygalactose transaminase